jgi:hypothetical protein
MLVAVLLLLCSSPKNLCAQGTDSVPDAGKLAGQYLNAVAGKSGSVSRDIDRQTTKYLSKFQQEEAGIYKKLAKKDSTAAARAMAASKKQYATLQQKLNTTSQTITTKTKGYIPLLDTLSTSLKFLKQYGDLFKKGIAGSQQLNSTLSQVNGMEGKLQQADDVQAFIKDRQQQLTAQLQQAGMSNALSGFNKDAYYYSAQLSEYRAALNDPDKAEQKAIALLNRLPAFQQFMKQNSFLASLFSTPGNSSIATTALQGLQTRTQVQQLLQNQISAGGPNAQSAVEQNIQAAQAQLNTLKDKLSKLGGGNSDAAMPDFKPNMQKTKTFLQRLEYGTNIQTQKSGGFFPVTTAIGLSAGYKLNDKSTVGIGVNYNIGWGKDIQHIAISSQGLGFRTFVDMKLKGSFWVSSGGELNYLSSFRDFKILDDFSPWQKLALLGITKKYKVAKRTGNIQLLYDFLWKQQVPAGQPLLFRIGYTL